MTLLGNQVKVVLDGFAAVNQRMTQLDSRTALGARAGLYAGPWTRQVMIIIRERCKLL